MADKIDATDQRARGAQDPENIVEPVRDRTAEPKKQCEDQCACGKNEKVGNRFVQRKCIAPNKGGQRHPRYKAISRHTPSGA
ncbi:MAG: hypothetical protein ACLU8W_11660 [Clostridia bacterium]